MPSHPHDRLFRRTFSNPAHAIEELRVVLPADLVAALDLVRLELVNGASFIDEALDSTTGWTGSTRFVDRLAMPEPLRPMLAPHIPDFEFILDDLTRHTEEELHTRAVTAALRLLLSAMRLGRDGQPSDIGRWARLLVETLAEPNGHQAFEAFLRYLVAIRDDNFIDVLVQATKDTRVETIAMTYKERLIQQGLEQGLQRGEARGARQVLAKQLRLKFGELDAATQSRLEAGSLAELDRWTERVLTAESLAAVFAD